MGKLTRTNIADLLEDEHEQTLEKTDLLQEILTNFRYEGRLSFGKNLKAARGVLRFFKKEVVEHIDLEERVLFPFLKTHFPKLDTAVHLLRAEHEDFRANLRAFELELRKLSGNRKDMNRGKIVDRIRETGIYLIYLLRSHLRTESKSLYKVIDREIRQDEKKKLQNRVRERCFRRR